MLIYIPALIALMVKLYLLYRYRGSWMGMTLSKTLLGLLLLVQVITNVLELLAYYYIDSHSATVLALKVYYVALLWILVFLQQISMIVVWKKPSRFWSWLNYLTAIVLVCGFLFSDLIISGASSIEYTVTRIAGAYYWVVPAYVLIALVLSTGTCVYGYHTLKSQFEKIRCVYLLLALSCQLTPLVIAQVLMAFDIRVSAAVMLPIGTSLFLILVSYALSKEELYDVRRLIPFTRMYHFARNQRHLIM